MMSTPVIHRVVWSAVALTVLMAPRLSRTGKSMQMFLRDPNGVRIELYVLLPAK